MIVDCHCHAGPGDGWTGPLDTGAQLDRYLERARRAGIDRTVLFAAFHPDYRVANRAVARIVAARPDRFFGFVFVHAERDRGRLAAMVGEAVARYRFSGIKVHRYDSRLSREICEAARDWSLPILYDPMGEVAPLENLVSQYHDVAFIFPHLGSFADDWAAQRKVLDLIARHDNVHTDTAGVRRFDLLVEAVRRGGAHKVLFGSDGPWLHPGVELAKIRELPLDDRQRALVMGGNLLRLIGAGSRCDNLPHGVTRRSDWPDAAAVRDR
jgi:hypothetical protein